MTGIETNNYGDCGDGDYSTWTTIPLLGNNHPEYANNVMVFKEGSTIKVTSSNILIKNVTIYDICGSKLYSQADINNTEVAITGLQIQQQVLIDEITTPKGSEIRRVIF